MTELIHILSSHWSLPNGLGEVVRHAAPAGRTIELADCQAMTGETILLSGFPRPLPVANRNFVWTTFESDRIPAEWVETLNACYRAVLVPHPTVRRWFLRSGVAVPVHTVAQGFKRLRRTRPLPRRGDRLRVGLVGLLLARKNAATLIRAVTELESEGYALSLSLRFTSRLTAEMAELIERSGDVPFLDLAFTPALTDEELSDWYSSLHAYICPSSGEGWSMTPRESLYLGIPTIVSAIPVHRELLSSGCCTRVATSGREPAFYPFLDRTCGRWSRVSVGAIKSALVEVYDHYEAKRRRARAGAAWIARRWRWESALRRLVARIRAASH